MIRHDEASGLWFITAEAQQMVVGVKGGRSPVVVHWGAPLPEASLDRIPAFPNGYSVFGEAEDKSYTPNKLPLAYPWPQAGDFRSPAFDISDAAGRPALDLRFTGARVVPGFPDRQGLPGARPRPEDGPPETLELAFDDPVTGLGLVLRFTAAGPALLRSTVVTNAGPGPLTLHRLLSFNADLNPDREADLVTLDGAWARERTPRRFALPAGRLETSSRRGVSSHQAWPGLVLADRRATEAQGEVRAAALVWSGDWILGAERTEDGGWRLQGGLHPDLARRTLAPGQRFTTPEAVLFYSTEGLGGLSRASHRFVQRHLVPEAWADKPRPIVLNNWEATYWAFTETKLLALADRAAASGIEVFVLDDGWFGRRENDRSSLGDWEPHPAKLPRGLGAFGRALADRGLGFGLWIEPEMVSADSDLYRAHPDWCLHLEGRDRVESRHQLVLDLSRPEVVDHLETVFTEVLASAPLAFVKWDMNRPLSHAGADRFAWVLGLYDLARRLTSKFPQILFEGCCGGGGRTDFGMLTFFPQMWISDNTDALARLTIQEGTSLFLPPAVMGAHVSAVPNHQTGRITPWGARTRCAFGGNLGYELDLTALGPDDLAALARDTAWYKAHRALVQQGAFRRTRTTLEDPNTVAWQVHGPENGQVLLLWFRPRAEANPAFPLYRFEGLDPAARYRLDWWADRRPPGALAAAVLSGAELMHRGLVIPLEGGDADGAAVVLTRIVP